MATAIKKIKNVINNQKYNQKIKDLDKTCPVGQDSVKSGNKDMLTKRSGIHMDQIDDTTPIEIEVIDDFEATGNPTAEIVSAIDSSGTPVSDFNDYRESRRQIEKNTLKKPSPHPLNDITNSNSSEKKAMTAWTDRIVLTKMVYRLETK